MIAHDWSATVVKVTDGDTLRLHLSRDVPLVHGWKHTISDDMPTGQAVRLVILDTPERGHPGYLEAAADVRDWLMNVTLAGRTLRCETYNSGGFDRILGDLYVDGDRSQSLSQHMLRLGWLPYLPTR